jgi:hypothetical protein
MLSTMIFLVLLSIVFVEGTSIPNESCEAQISSWPDPCTGTIIVSRSCESATLHFEMTPFKLCDSIYLMWSYPLNNLTMIIETSFTQRHQSYSIGLKNLTEYDIRKYLILNGKEIEIKSTEDIIVLHSDSNYQIKLKLQAETTISYYGFPISYNVTKI